MHSIQWLKGACGAGLHHIQMQIHHKSRTTHMTTALHPVVQRKKNSTQKSKNPYDYSNMEGICSWRQAPTCRHLICKPTRVCLKPLYVPTLNSFAQCCSSTEAHATGASLGSLSHHITETCHAILTNPKEHSDSLSSVPNISKPT